MRHVRPLIVLGSLALLAGCGGSSSSEAPAPAKPAARAAQTPAPAPAAPAAAPAPDAEKLQAILADADAKDGTVDKIVSKCAGCGLGMDGSPEHAVQAHGYTLHFCAATCKSFNEGRIDKTIASLE